MTEPTNDSDDLVMVADDATIAAVVAEMQGGKATPLSPEQVADRDARLAEEHAARVTEQFWRDERDTALREARQRDEANARATEADRQIAADRKARNDEINQRIKERADRVGQRPDRRRNEIAAASRRQEKFRNALLQEVQRAAIVRQHDEIAKGIRDFYFHADPDAPDVDLGRDPITGFRKIKRGDFSLFD